MIAFGFMLAAAGVILLIIGAAQAAQNRVFRDAQTVTGTVIYKHSQSRKVGRAYLFRLSYSVDGIAYEREVGVAATEYEVIEVGEQYEVLYRPDKPKRIMRPQDVSPKNVKIILIFSAVLIVTGIAFVLIGRYVNLLWRV